ncbi:MAG: glycosyltransferase [Pseudomonadota bacterium]
MALRHKLIAARSLGTKAWMHFRTHGAASTASVVYNRLRHGAAHGAHAANIPIGSASSPFANETARLARDVFSKSQIAIIGDMNLPQCKKYRMLQKLEILEDANHAATHSHWQDLQRATNLLQLATAAIFYRVPAGPEYTYYLEECRRLGVKVIYDLDDPIFSSEIYKANVNLDFLTLAERTHLLSGCASYLMAMRAADHLIGSTPRICDEMRKLTGRPVTLWRNLIDGEARHAANRTISNATVQESPSDRVQIVYASGSRAHEADFRVIGAPLLAHMEAHENVDLHVIGYLELPDAFEKFEGRITSAQFTDFPDYLSELSRCDYGIIPLVDDVFNDCKSAIRYLDAALVKLPVIASATGDFKHVCKHDETALLAHNEADWADALTQLTKSSAERSRLGGAAYLDATATQTTKDYYYRLDRSLRTLLTPDAPMVELNNAA